MKRRVQLREYQTLPPALAQPATLFEPNGQNQVTTKSHMTLEMSRLYIGIND